jgi:hypothetical protein
MFDEYEDLAPEQCPDCGGNHTRTDWLFNFHKCEDCSALWAFDKNDPDYDEIDPIVDIEAISELTKN